MPSRKIIENTVVEAKFGILRSDIYVKNLLEMCLILLAIWLLFIMLLLEKLKIVLNFDPKLS